MRFLNELSINVNNSSSINNVNDTIIVNNSANAIASVVDSLFEIAHANADDNGNASLNAIVAHANVNMNANNAIVDNAANISNVVDFADNNDLHFAGEMM